MNAVCLVWINYWINHGAQGFNVIQISRYLELETHIKASVYTHSDGPQLKSGQRAWPQNVRNHTNGDKERHFQALYTHTYIYKEIIVLIKKIKKYSVFQTLDQLLPGETLADFRKSYKNCWTISLMTIQ